ncbi:hypothetical protein K502DRAFT_352058 [Neoconidiobolus thromboides FSU 785]|nr:hypothetical protein K502DRAFT_352058 [Neoconidiobolus thromboides FSU 785]
MDFSIYFYNKNDYYEHLSPYLSEEALKAIEGNNVDCFELCRRGDKNYLRLGRSNHKGSVNKLIKDKLVKGNPERIKTKKNVEGPFNFGQGRGKRNNKNSHKFNRNINGYIEEYDNYNQINKQKENGYSKFNQNGIMKKCGIFIGSIKVIPKKKETSIRFNSIKNDFDYNEFDRVEIKLRKLDDVKYSDGKNASISNRLHVVSAKCNPIHFHELGVLSVRECARVQGLLDQDGFCSTIKDQYMLIGNAALRRIAFAFGLEN